MPAVDVADEGGVGEVPLPRRQGLDGEVVDVHWDVVVDQSVRWVVLSEPTRGPLILLPEIVEFRRGQLGEVFREADVEFDELLGDVFALEVVGLEEVGRGAVAEGEGEFPGEIVGVLDARVHALGCLWGVRVAAVADEEEAFAVVEAVGDALGDGVSADPVDFVQFDGVGFEDGGEFSFEEI